MHAHNRCIRRPQLRRLSIKSDCVVVVVVVLVVVVVVCFRLHESPLQGSLPLYERSWSSAAFTCFPAKRSTRTVSRSSTAPMRPIRAGFVSTSTNVVHECVGFGSLVMAVGCGRPCVIFRMQSVFWIAHARSARWVRLPVTAIATSHCECFTTVSTTIPAATAAGTIFTTAATTSTPIHMRPVPLPLPRLLPVRLLLP